MTEEDQDSPDQARTVFMPAASSKRTLPEPSVASTSPRPEPEPAFPAQDARVAPKGTGRVEVGSVLNHIYRVTRFIARGGMGEVFEGTNINSDERVAIKVMLPQLAADPTVQEMFRKEARTLTKLSHPAVVQYRLLAQEPELGVLYIVTEFIDGLALAEVMHRLNATEQDLRMLLRRLAEGLRAAHELGAIHRDISPDNILLAGERLDRAKIIDFGIAKDLDPTKATMVGEGFAGKLGYVAPEQFGDFDRQIGPWTDVYSLGLVVLAAALGRDVDMGTTLVDAIDKRRAGPDLSPIPLALRPTLERMLKADPAHRLRSMDEVIAALDAPAAATKPATPAAKTVWAPKSRATADSAEPVIPAVAGFVRRPSKSPMPLIITGGVTAALMLVGLIVLITLPKGHAPATVGAAQTAGGPPRAEVARRAVEAALSGVSCSWLAISGAVDQPSGVAIKLAGVAASPAAAQAAVIRAAGAVNVPVADVNVDDDVAPVGQSVCTPIDAFRSIRSSGISRLVSVRRVYQVMNQADGKHAAQAIINLDLSGLQGDFALFGLEPDGAVSPIIRSRAELAADLKDRGYRRHIADLGGGRYRFSIDTGHDGWSGMLLLSGAMAIDTALVATPAAPRSPDWISRFRRASSQGGWKADMVWYKTVERTMASAVRAASSPPPSARRPL